MRVAQQLVFHVEEAAVHEVVAFDAREAQGEMRVAMAFVRASELVRESAGGGDESEDILVHEIDIAQAPGWLSGKLAEGYSIDAKVWAGLYFLERNPDGSPA